MDNLNRARERGVNNFGERTDLEALLRAASLPSSTAHPERGVRGPSNLQSSSDVTEQSNSYDP